jgi:hypothetical protein
LLFPVFPALVSLGERIMSLRLTWSQTKKEGGGGGGGGMLKFTIKSSF